MRITALSSALANAWISCLSKYPSWSMAPRGAHFSIVLLTDSMIPPSLSRSEKDRSRIDLYTLDLWGIAATSETFRCRGWLVFISSHRTTHACPFSTLLATSSAKCAMVSGSRADLCGPWLIAAWILSRVQSHPVLVGHPNCSQSARSLAALCFSASPCSAISRVSDVFCC